MYVYFFFFFFCHDAQIVCVCTENKIMADNRHPWEIQRSEEKVHPPVASVEYVNAWESRQFKRACFMEDTGHANLPAEWSDDDVENIRYLHLGLKAAQRFEAECKDDDDDEFEVHVEYTPQLEETLRSRQTFGGGRDYLMLAFQFLDTHSDVNDPEEWKHRFVCHQLAIRWIRQGTLPSGSILNEDKRELYLKEALRHGHVVMAWKSPTLRKVKQIKEIDFDLIMQKPSLTRQVMRKGNRKIIRWLQKLGMLDNDVAVRWLVDVAEFDVGLLEYLFPGDSERRQYAVHYAQNR